MKAKPLTDEIKFRLRDPIPFYSGGIVFPVEYMTREELLKRYPMSEAAQRLARKEKRMSRSMQSVEEKIIEFFQEAPQASVEIVHRLVGGIVRKRFPGRPKFAVKKSSKKSPAQVAAAQE